MVAASRRQFAGSARLLGKSLPIELKVMKSKALTSDALAPQMIVYAVLAAMMMVARMIFAGGVLPRIRSILPIRPASMPR